MTKHQWLGGVVCLAMAAFLACAAPIPTAAPAGGGAAKPAETLSAQQQPPSKPAEPSFLDLAKTAKAASYKVTYRMSGTSGGQTVSGDQTWYLKPPKSRFDFSMAAGGPAGSASMFNLEDGMFLCTSQAGSPTCLKMPKEQAAQQNQGAQAQEQVQGSPDQFDTTYQGTRQIAGQQAQCFALKPKGSAQAGLTQGTFCYTTQGIPLLMQSKGQGFDVSMEASSFSASVTDADFKLPAQPMELPVIPRGAGDRGY